MDLFRTFRTKGAFFDKEAIILASFAVVCPIIGSLLWILQKHSNWYYPFFLIGILLFICWATFIEQHFDIVYTP